MPPTRTNTSPFLPTCLSGKIALVTGGGSGICYEITKQLLSHGCAGAVICGRRETFLQNASTSFLPHKCLYKVCDVRDPTQCKEAVEYCVREFGRMDILVNGAAGNFLAEAKSLRPKGFQTVMAIDALGTFNMCHAAHPHLKKSIVNDPSATATILNISATLQYGATWYQAHASAAKSAVDSLTRSLALEWGTDRIRVCGIAPGPIADTPGTTKLAPGLDSSDVNDMVAEGIPLGRMGEAFDIAMTAVFLCSEGGGSYVTGDVVVVDGGQWLWKPPMVEREMVAELARSVEKKSREQAPKFASKL